jgi:GAF domain-containing protein
MAKAMATEAENEARRLAALRETGMLFTEPSAGFDRVLLLAREVFAVPFGGVSFIDARHQWFKARMGFAEPAFRREDSFCNDTIKGDGVLFVEDAAADVRFRDSPLVAGEPGLRFYAGAPVSLAPGLRIGTVCVADTRPRLLKPSERAVLVALAAIVVQELRLLHASRIIRQKLGSPSRRSDERNVG